MFRKLNKSERFTPGFICVLQAIYYSDARVEALDDRFVIDLSYVDFNSFEYIDREFYVSLRKDVQPKDSVGCVISLYAEHDEFNTYRVVFSGTRVEILV